MPVLADIDILSSIMDGDIGIEPFCMEMIQPASVDLRLGDELGEPGWDDGIGMDEAGAAAGRVRWTKLEDGGRILPPGGFVLARTLERIRVPARCGAVLRNRNSLAAIGLDAAAGCNITPGYEGHMPLVISNRGPKGIRLVPGGRICQMVFFALAETPLRGYADRSNPEELWKAVEAGRKAIGSRLKVIPRRQ